MEVFYDKKERDEVIFMEEVIELLSRADAASSYDQIKKQYLQRLQVIASYDPKEEYIPPFKAFTCSISRNVMDDPVSPCTGTACERTALEAWFMRGEKTDPATGGPLEDLSYRSNICLRQSIQEWKELNYCLKIISCKEKLLSNVDLSVVAALDQMQQLMREDSINKEWISLGGLTEIIVSSLGRSDNIVVKEKILVTLKDVVEGNPRNKSEAVKSKGFDHIIPCLGVDSSLTEVAVELLYELSQGRSVTEASVCRELSHIVPVIEIEHFSHEHPLIFEEENKDDGVQISCHVCQQPISGPCYKCRQCKHFFLHKECAELPKEMRHPMHPQHSLILLPNPHYSESPCECSVCQRPFESFTYNCSLGKFNVDILCALIMHKIEHKCHKHPLTPLQRPTLILCDACGTRHEGVSYQCTTCQFWVNQKCFWLPSSIKYRHHKHLLSLTYSLSYEHFKFTPNCNICSEKVDRSFWTYYCADCKYFAHVNCLTSKAKLSSEQEAEICIGKLDQFQILLPAPDESINPVTYLTKNIDLQGKTRRSTKLYHVSHHHPLFLVDKQINDESCCMNERITCDGCTKPVSTPFYHCAECNFILHDYCAELPIELNHQVHADHPLILNRWEFIDSRVPLCRGCKMSCDGVLYGCGACFFFLDIKCAFLMGNILHGAHHHFLTLGETTGGLCTACHNNIYGLGLVCVICNFKLHTICALLPRTVRHRYDKHPFSLTYSGNQDEYYCEICEQEINPQRWFYHCEDCNQSLDKECILPGSKAVLLHKHAPEIQPKALQPR